MSPSRVSRVGRSSTPSPGSTSTARCGSARSATSGTTSRPTTPQSQRTTSRRSSSRPTARSSTPSPSRRRPPPRTCLWWTLASRRRSWAASRPPWCRPSRCSRRTRSLGSSPTAPRCTCTSSASASAPSRTCSGGLRNSHLRRSTSSWASPRARRWAPRGNPRPRRPRRGRGASGASSSPSPSASSHSPPSWRSCRWMPSQRPRRSAPPAARAPPSAWPRVSSARACPGRARAACSLSGGPPPRAAAPWWSGSSRSRCAPTRTWRRTARPCTARPASTTRAWRGR
mmetsp:Transcript_54019/g.171418  ORF Transcript_54019/g.171418 Transcript_54019/m.171418 type:complete len:285 (-) Transcript_54019:1405-2259(-)